MTRSQTFERPEGGGKGVGKGAQTSEPLYKESPFGSEIGLQSGPDRKCSENPFPHETYFKMRSPSWGSFCGDVRGGTPRPPF